MESKEDILKKHLVGMVGRTKESYVSVDEMSKQPEFQSTLAAMEEYKSQRKELSSNEIDSAAEFELNQTEGVDWDDLIGLFVAGVKWGRDYK